MTRGARVPSGCAPRAGASPAAARPLHFVAPRRAATCSAAGAQLNSTVVVAVGDPLVARAVLRALARAGHHGVSVGGDARCRAPSLAVSVAGRALSPGDAMRVDGVVVDEAGMAGAAMELATLAVDARGGPPFVVLLADRAARDATDDPLRRAAVAQLQKPFAARDLLLAVQRARTALHRAEESSPTPLVVDVRRTCAR